VYFNGSDLFLQSADPNSPLTANGAPIPLSWTAVYAPCEIGIGGARLWFGSPAALSTMGPQAAPNPAPPAAAPPVSAPVSAPAPAEGAFDRAAALDRLAGDEGLLRELCEVFLEEEPKWRAEIRAAVAARDAASLKRAAHTLKGAVDSIGGARAYRAALELERMGREGNLDGAEAALAELERELDALVPALRAFSAPAASPS
jgi:HPt (histidine-containing phosphotransfer) domain-containing protein